MEAFIVSAFRALRSLLLPGMFGVFVLCVLTTLAVLAGFVIGAGFFFTWLSGYVHNAGLATYMPWLGTIGSALIAWFLFPGIMPVVASFFDERITDLIETQEYPGAASAHRSPFLVEMLHDLGFSVKAILLNLIVMPLYLVPVVNLVVFPLLNGWLLGREFFVMVARRHLPLAEAEALRRRHGRSVLLSGVVLTLLALIPVVNLFAPFWGVAVMVHLFHKQNPPTPIYTK